jgi:hypothetical protein
MTTISIPLSDERVAQLRLRAAAYVLEKNAELYRRLA